MRTEKDRLNNNKTEQDKLQDAVERYFAHVEQNTSTSVQNFDEEKVYGQIQQQISHAKRRNSNSLQWFSLAASILIVLGLGLWLRTDKHTLKSDFKESSIKETPILPGSNTAILTLADGSKISLDTMQTGTITTADSIQITKDETGQISYRHAVESNRGKPITHSLETPKGGQYALVLPDGTKVWLNADSKIRYLSEFIGPTREVELEGEAYFEVTPNAKKPFIVKTPQQHVQVLGTSFNVYAYPQETEQTTLLEGSVNIKSDTQEVPLAPGQQANISTTQQLKKIRVDPSLFTAWKNGDFSFHNTHLKDVMNQISRWYNIDIVYDKESSNLRLNGIVSRSKHLDTVLEVLEMTGKVKFQLETNKKTKERRIRIISI